MYAPLKYGTLARLVPSEILFFVQNLLGAQVRAHVAAQHFGDLGARWYFTAEHASAL